MTESFNDFLSKDDLDPKVIQQFKQAVDRNEPEAVRQILQSHPSLVSRIDEPSFAFDTPAIVIASYRGNRQMVDVLLQFGADINTKSSWWAGGFGVLHHDHHNLSRYLIERGARVDPHAAAALGMIDVLQKMVEEDAEVVNQRGPDGQVPLHYAVSSDVIDFLLDHGADIDMRDIDHNSTPAQYAVNKPDKCKHLIKRGAQTDIFMAVQLGDLELVRRILNENPNALEAQVGKREFTSGESNGGHIYEYMIGTGARPFFLAAHLGHEAITELMLPYSSVEQRLLLACMRADTETVHAMLREHRNIIQSLDWEYQSMITNAAWDHRIAAVQLMLDVGFQPDARRNEHSMTALHHAAIRGDNEIVQLLLGRGASIDIRNEYGGTPLNSCMWGSMHNQDPQGDYAAVAESLIAAGVTLPEKATGSELVKSVLMRHGVPA
ncbi:ankyrin repeat domain-containing protein [Paenibacillus sp. P36]|uniref:ankyrin repeat domain-containing protein n=1 Tax=Paenibacillus sp. P36 TaxID=3342538 RepID=UPI0038B34556